MIFQILMTRDDDIITVLISVWRAEHRTCRSEMLLHPKTNSLSIKMHRKPERHHDEARSQSCIHWAPWFLFGPAQQGIWLTHSSFPPHLSFLINQLDLLIKNTEQWVVLLRSVDSHGGNVIFLPHLSVG